jgi:hypothetical protein
MKRIKLVHLFFLFVICNLVKAQQIDYKEWKTKCIEGDCKNGVGKLKVISEKDKTSTAYEIYIGTFVDKQLNGLAEIESYIGEEKRRSLKASFKDGLFLKDSVWFTTAYGMSSSKGKGVLDTYSNNESSKGTIYLKDGVIDIKYKERPEIKSERRIGDLSITSYGEYSTKANKTITTYKNGLIIKNPDENVKTKPGAVFETNCSITFPNNGSEFPCNGYVHALGEHDISADINNQKKIKLSENLPGNAVRTGNFLLFSRNPCSKEGEFETNFADGTKTTETYKNNLVIASSSISKEKKDSIAATIALRKKLEKEAYDATPEGQLEIARIEAIRNQPTEAQKWLIEQQKKSAQKDAENKRAYEASQEVFDAGVVLKRMEKADCYKCNGGLISKSPKCKYCKMGIVESTTKENKTEYISGGIGSTGGLLETEKTTKWESKCVKCKGTGYYHCDDCTSSK